MADLTYSCSFLLGILCYGLYKRYEVWTLAKGEIHRYDQIGISYPVMVYLYLAQARIIRKPLAGWMHAFLFGACVVLLWPLELLAAHYWIHWPPIEGNIYIDFSRFVDARPAIPDCIIGLPFVRYIQKRERLKTTARHLMAG
jgi:hypothetical protein